MGGPDINAVIQNNNWETNSRIHPKWCILLNKWCKFRNKFHVHQKFYSFRQSWKRFLNYWAFIYKWDSSIAFLLFWVWKTSTEVCQIWWSPRTQIRVTIVHSFLRIHKKLRSWLNLFSFRKNNFHSTSALLSHSVHHLTEIETCLQAFRSQIFFMPCLIFSPKLHSAMMILEISLKLIDTWCPLFFYSRH